MEKFCTCPKCGSDIVKNAKAYSCTDKDCTCVIFREDRFFERFGKAMTDTVAKSLFTKGYVDVKGMVSPKSGKSFDSRIKVSFDEKYPKYEFDFDAVKK